LPKPNRHLFDRELRFHSKKNLTLKSIPALDDLLNLKVKHMRGVNRVMLIGNLGKDPDVQFLEGNIAVAKFPLATTETFKDRSGKLVSQTEWHTVVLWRGLAELAQKYLHKSSLVYIEGRLRTRSWDDKDGNRKFATEVVGDNLIMLDKRMEGSASSNTSDSSHVEGMGGSDMPMGDPSENLPF
jgi:single-strand DNA-binding protein